MKKYFIYIILALTCLTFYSCKDSDLFFADNEQDHDNDEITGDDYVYHLPVIFHVLYKDEDAKDTLNRPIQLIPYERLVEILANVNDLYEGQLYNFGKEANEYSENLHVKLELALYDEQGQKLKTPGVEYIKYDGDYPIDSEKFMSQKKKKNKIIWDPNEYINVMVYNFKHEENKRTVLGVSCMPYTAKGYPQIEGLESVKTNVISKDNISFEYCVSLNSLYIYSQSSRYTDVDHGAKGFTYISSDVNVTLAHEIGHYLGLHHVFAEEKKGQDVTAANNCEDTDFCTDTKSYNKIKYDNWLTEYVNAHKDAESLNLRDLIKRSNDKGEEWDSDNLMDYAFSLSFRLTPEQHNRIRQVLYYSPLIPGPKKNRSSGSRSYDSGEPLDLPIQLIVDECQQ